MNYRFEVNFEKKNLSVEKNKECEELISYLVKKLKLYRFSETKVVREITDDTDLTKTCIFVCETKCRSDLFNKLSISDLHNGETEVFI